MNYAPSFAALHVKYFSHEVLVLAHAGEHFLMKHPSGGIVDPRCRLASTTLVTSRQAGSISLRVAAARFASVCLTYANMVVGKKEPW